jgi:hypothetical protein
VGWFWVDLSGVGEGTVLVSFKFIDNGSIPGELSELLDSFCVFGESSLIMLGSFEFIDDGCITGGSDCLYNFFCSSSAILFC